LRGGIVLWRVALSASAVCVSATAATALRLWLDGTPLDERSLTLLAVMACGSLLATAIGAQVAWYVTRRVHDTRKRAAWMAVLLPAFAYTVLSVIFGTHFYLTAFGSLGNPLRDATMRILGSVAIGTVYFTIFSPRFLFPWVIPGLAIAVILMASPRLSRRQRADNPMTPATDPESAP
jgi:hypothetical protein